MNAAQFKKAVSLAISGEGLPSYFSAEMDEAIGGCALDNKRRFVTLETVASMIRGQAITYGGNILQEEIEECRCLSKRFDIIGE